MPNSRRILSVFYAALIAFSLFPACDDSDSFTTSSGALLTFSTDTVRFDTVISTIGSTTQQLMVYNRNDDGVRITEVRMSGGANTAFRVNVDGSYLDPESGAVAYDFEVRGGDSIRVFAEVTVPYSDEDAPVYLADTLLFLLESGVQQGVVMTAVGQDAYFWQAITISADTIIATSRPIVIYDSVVVGAGITLTLSAGTRLFFHDDAVMYVDGSVQAQGTSDQNVVFRCDRTDYMFSYLPYDNTPSRWGGIVLRTKSQDNIFSYVDIHSGSWGIACDSATTDATKLTLENSVIHNVSGDGLSLYNCKAIVGNTQISNTLGNCVTVVGGDVRFVHSTIAQFYPWDSDRGDALYLANVYLSQDYPIEQAYFLNCLITGYADDVVMGSIDDNNDDVNYLFDHCVLRTVESDDARFVDITYEDTDDETHGKGQFTTFDTDNFIYDFRLNADAISRNKASQEWAADYPYDAYGTSRIDSEAPDAGAYEYTSDSTGEVDE